MPTNLKKKTNERQLFDIDFFVKYLRTNRVENCPLVSSEPNVASIIGVKTIPHCMCMCMLENACVINVRKWATVIGFGNQQMHFLASVSPFFNPLDTTDNFEGAHWFKTFDQKKIRDEILT